jgi:hypothetical protein
MDAFIGLVLDRLLATSIQTALLSTAAWLLCRYVPRLPPASQCWLWWLIALQAIAGLVITPIELPWLPHSGPAIPDVTSVTPWNDALIEGLPVTILPDEHPRSFWPLTAFLLWVAGVLVMSWSSLRGWLQMRQLLQTSSPCTDEQLLRKVARHSEASGVSSAPKIHVSRQIDSPLLIGHRHPVLLLPDATLFSDEELDMIFAHELAHLRRCDLWWACVPSLARQLFFFHPLVHLAASEYGMAREAACDAEAIGVQHASRERYGRLLIHFGTSPSSSAAFAVASPTFRTLSRRLTMLQHTSFLPRAISVALVTLVAATGVLPVRLVEAAAAKSAPGLPATMDQADQPGKPELEENFLKRQLLESEQRLRETEARRKEEKAQAVAQQTTLQSELARLRAELHTLAGMNNAHPDEGSFRSQRAGLAGHTGAGAPVSARIAVARENLATLLLRYNEKHPAVIQQIELLRHLEQPSENGMGSGPENLSGAIPSGSQQHTQQSSTLSQVAPGDYRIARGDVLQIEVWEQPALGATLTVRPDGKVSTPLVENTLAAGKTPSQLARDIETGLAKFVRGPKVTVILK